MTLGLMGNSWGFHDDSFHPPYLAAWARLELGWVEPVEPTPGGQILELEASALPLTPESSPKMYKIGDGKFGFPSGEYLLLENRQAYGYDEHIPSSVSSFRNVCSFFRVAFGIFDLTSARWKRVLVGLSLGHSHLAH
jgi:hypothetical protein